MTFDEVLSQVQALLQREQRVSYRGLKRRFNLDDEYLEDLKEELIGAKRLATDEDGRFLVWTGDTTLVSPQLSVASSSQPPAPQTPNTELRTQAPSPQTPDSRLRDSRLDAAERRQLTVMFCDLVGSTALSAQLDPEELREVVRAYQQTSSAVIERFGGHIAQYLGDGLLVYFGYPAAHEDDAARAVRAGLEIITTLRTQVPSPLMGEGQGEGRLQVRIGIHTGLVVVGEIGSSEKREMLALGETPNIAARIQGQAAPDEVMMSAATYRLIEGLFDCEDRGQPELKGVATPLTLYRVIKEGEAQSRFQVVVRKGLTPLIGRDHEYGLLQERWARTKEGVGQVVLLNGEPGIGKSRLVEALKETVEHEGTRCLELRCSPYHQNSALYPVIEHVQRMLQFRQADSPEEKLRKLVQVLGRRVEAQRPTEQSSDRVIASAAKQSLQGVVPLFAALLSLPHPEGYPVLSLSPQKQKEKTHEAIVAWLCEEAKQQAVTYAWEDLHWADPSTLELLTLFLAQVPATRLLAIFTYRPEFTPPWGSHSYLSQLTLSRLGRNHVETMVEKVTGGRTLPKEVVQQIVNKTDGVPLFVEELTKTVLESVGSIESIGSGGRLGRSSIPLGIPATLQDTLMARLDRLGPTKEIAQVGATIGREFNYDLLQAVSSLNEGALQQGLKQLVEAELVFQSGVPPQARYLFKHALVQDTAYQSLLKSRRQQLHQTIGKVLEEQFPETKETHPELIAHHYTEGSLIVQAIPYWQQAGQRAIQHSANEEAVTHLTTGLELLKTLPDTPERPLQEMTLQTALGSALLVTKGLGAHEVRETYDRVRELGRNLGDTPELYPALSGLSMYYLQQEEMLTAIELGQHCLSLAERQQDTGRIIDAHRLQVGNWFFHGEPARAHEHCEQGMALYDFAQHHALAFVYGLEGGVTCMAMGAWALWYLGYPDQALERSLTSLALARQGTHQPTLAWALEATSWLHYYRREGQAAYALADEAVTFSIQQDFPHWVAMGLKRRGEALVLLGQWEEGMRQLQQGDEGYRATGAAAGWARALAEAARGCLHQGQYEEGLRLVDEALQLMNKKTMRFYAAEKYRIKGELLLAQESKNQKSKGKSQKSKIETSPQPLTPSTQEAETCFLKAIEIAQRQKAKSWELRATMSLARLWQSQGKQKEAHQILSEIYGWFTEGFDTKDLQEAEALLEELVAT